MTAMLEAAIGYARAGIPVFPLWSAVPFRNGGFVCGCGRLNCTSPAKHPLAKAAPHGLKNATTDELKVRSFWENYPTANIGAATGNIVVIDIDVYRGGDLGEIERIFFGSSMIRTWRAATGGGGDHLFFSADLPVRCSRDKLAKGVDVRGIGGLVVLPPSLHISGKRYGWQPEQAPGELPLAPLPVSIITALQQRAISANIDWSELAASEVCEGGRNDTIASFAGHLLRHYVDPRVVFSLLLAWNETHCNPPLDRAEVVKTINSIAGIELRRRSQQ